MPQLGCKLSLGFSAYFFFFSFLFTFVSEGWCPSRVSWILGSIVHQEGQLVLSVVADTRYQLTPLMQHFCKTLGSHDGLLAQHELDSSIFIVTCEWRLMPQLGYKLGWSLYAHYFSIFQSYGWCPSWAASLAEACLLIIFSFLWVTIDVLATLQAQLKLVCSFFFQYL
jgi:hypothetical protein